MQRYIVEVHREYTEWKNEEGNLHRLDGPAIEYSNGDKSYWENGKRHRLDGPAVIFINGYTAYFQNGEPHRIAGPAIVHADGIKEYWIDGIMLTEDDFNQRKCNPDTIVVNGVTYKRAHV